jgi:hypothetical protein
VLLVDHESFLDRDTREIMIMVGRRCLRPARSLSSSSRLVVQILVLLFFHHTVDRSIAFCPPPLLHDNTARGEGAAVPSIRRGGLLLLMMATSSTSSTSTSPINPQKLIRGNAYGTIHNSTVPTAAEVAATLGIRPPAEVPPRVWKRAYDTLRYAAPFLHAFDPLSPPNSSLNLYCLWWKALSGNDVSSPILYDGGLAASLLPVTSRWLVKDPLCRLYPRLHHANVELRTAYLDASVEYLASTAVRRQQEQQQPQATGPPPRRRTMKIRLVSFGSGYDVRSVKFLRRRHGMVHIDEAVELDLPDVVRSKSALLASRRFRHGLRTSQGLYHPHNDDDDKDDDRWPRLVPVDLNDLDAVRVALMEILGPKKEDKKKKNDDNDDDEQQQPLYHTIFLFEAVMIYLNEGIPRALLRLCRSVLDDDDNKSLSGSLCFADRLENIPSGDVQIATAELEALGWQLIDWRPKPGLARHMGRAVPM